VLLHLVDWHWVTAWPSVSDDEPSAILYPLPTNPATVFTVTCTASQLPSPVNAVTWLKPDGNSVMIPFTLASHSASDGLGQEYVVMFNTSTSMLNPGAVIQLQWTV